MIARLLISSLPERRAEIAKILASHITHENSDYTKHPDVLIFPSDSKLGILEARKIKEHFLLKPYSAKGRAVVLEDAALLTHEAQNALLKTLEEPPPDAVLILAASSESKFLPTILSRCQIIRVKESESQRVIGEKQKEIELLLNASLEERFEYIEKLKEREEFLHSLSWYFHQNISSYIKDRGFLKELLQGEEWANQNVNTRAILEYLMLVMPRKV